VTLDTASLISSGKMQSDCNDIRITYHGVEISSQVIAPNTSETKIWFQIDLLASQSDYEVYMYYGNATDTAPDYSSQSSISWDAGTYTVDTGKITATFDPTGGIIGQIKHNMNDQDLMTAYAQRGLGYLFSNNPSVYYIFRVDETDDTVLLTEDGPIVKVITAYSGESPQWIQQNAFYNNQEFVDFKVIRPVAASTEKFLVGTNDITPDGEFSASDTDELLRVDNAASDINVTFDNNWQYTPTNNLGYAGLTDPGFTNQLAFFWDETDTVDFTWKPRTTASEAGSYALFIGGDGTTNTYGTIDTDEFDYRFALSYSDTPSNADTQADYGVYRNSPPSAECTAEEVGTPDVTPPVVTITSPVNTTYDASSVTLEYTVSEAVSSCSYSLNGDPNVPITPGQSVTLDSLANDIYQLVVYATDFAGHTGSASVSFTVDVQVQTWWDTSWTYRLPVSIDTAAYDRTNEPIEHAIDFTQLFSDLGQSGLAFEINSVRVAEHDGAGAVMGEVVSQFDPNDGFDAATKADGTVVWVMDGLTTSGATRYYYIYFDSVDNAKSAPAYATNLDWNDTAKAISNTTLQATIGSAGTRSGISSFQYNGTEYLTNNGMVYIDGAPSTYEVLIDGPVKKTIKLTATANGSIDVTVYDLAEFVRLEGNITGSGWSFTPFPYLWSLNSGVCTNTLSYYDAGAVQTVTVGGDGWLGHAPQEGWACYEGVGANKGFCLVTDADTLAMSNNFWKNNSGGQQLMMPGLNPKPAGTINPNSWIVPMDTYQDGRDFWNKLASPVAASQGAPEAQAVTPTYDLIVSADSNGTVDPNGVVTVNQGDSQLFTATPNAGYEVDAWLVDSNSVQIGGTGYTLSDIQSTHTVSVTFKPILFTISGHILNPAGVALEAVAVTADNGGGVDTTDPNGHYQLTVGYGWSGTIIPAMQEYDFDPNSVDHVNVLADSVDDYVGHHIADLLTDGVIDVNDLQILCDNWLAAVLPNMDIQDDGKMDLQDFSILAEYWQEEL
jgi:hypothetical protein